MLKFWITLIRWMVIKLEHPEMSSGHSSISSKTWRNVFFAACGLVWFVFFSLWIHSMFEKKELYKLSREQIRQAIEGFDAKVPPPRMQHVKPWATSRDFRKAVGVLHVGVPATPDTLENQKLLIYPVQQAALGLHRTLVELDEKGDPQPGVALAWFYKNGNRTLQFELDPSAHFHDGTPIRAKDVAYTFSRIFWPENAGTDYEVLKQAIEGADQVQSGETPSGIHVVDPLHIEFYLNKTRPTFLQTISFPTLGIVPKHRYNGTNPLTSGEVVRAHYNKREKSWSLYRPAPSSVDLSLDPTAKLPMYYTRLLPFDQQAEETRNRIIAGEFDLIFGFSFSNFKKMNLPPEYTFTTFPNNGFTHMFYNMDRVYFEDRKFRKALSGFMQYLANQYHDPNHVFSRLTTYLPNYLMSASYYKKEKPLLDPETFKAQWSNQIPTRLKIVTPTNRLEQEFLDIISQGFQKIGVEIDWIEKPFDQFMPYLKSRDYDLLVGGYVCTNSEVECMISPLNNQDALAFTNADTSAFFEKIDEYLSLPTWAERTLAYEEALNALEDEHYVIPLFQNNMPVIAHRDLDLGILNPYDYHYHWISYWNMAWKRPESVGNAPNPPKDRA